ncbi:FecCD family ABC transporter permease [Crossiella cryophila]|uniref:Iron complex transport system permease protein n=1 Tax=Crossiella cryophila TaxID=43355 RepID=A0A7W7FU10_9PSEU|nr:iron chelate uptake ABC transporter family permease subunit [Crossiella cryophila]MBB4675324.1 iron complex transport system permease protein [Crossiella cryophila]
MTAKTEARVPGRPALRLAGASWTLRLRAVAVPVLGLAVLVFVLALNLTLGDFPISLGEVFAALLGGGDEAHRFILYDLRLPRALTGALVGAALGLAGAITQAIARNPLASPDLLGVSAGAGAGAVFVVMFGGSAGGLSGYLAAVGLPIAALIGGLLAAAVVYLLAWRRGIEGFRLVLVGIGVHAVLSNVTFWLLTLSDVADAGRAMVWLTGSLNARGWDHVLPVGIALAVLVPLTLFGARTLGALQFTDDTVRGLGVRVELSRSLLVLAAVGLAAVATASAGPIEFVALAVPQIALRLTGLAQPPLLASAVLGAALTVTADVLARTAFGSVELPVGIVTAILGAPYLVFLLVRRYREVRG